MTHSLARLTPGKKKNSTQRFLHCSAQEVFHCTDQDAKTNFFFFFSISSLRMLCYDMHACMYVCLAGTFWRAYPTPKLWFREDSIPTASCPRRFYLTFNLSSAAIVAEMGWDRRFRFLCRAPLCWQKTRIIFNVAGGMALGMVMWGTDPDNRLIATDDSFGLRRRRGG